MGFKSIETHAFAGVGVVQMSRFIGACIQSVGKTQMP